MRVIILRSKFNYVTLLLGTCQYLPTLPRTPWCHPIVGPWVSWLCLDLWLLLPTNPLHVPSPASPVHRAPWTPMLPQNSVSWLSSLTIPTSRPSSPNPPHPLWGNKVSLSEIGSLWRNLWRWLSPSPQEKKNDSKFLPGNMIPTFSILGSLGEGDTKLLKTLIVSYSYSSKLLNSL